MAGRQLYVAMDEVLEAMETYGEGSPTFYLDLQNGQIEMAIDPLLMGETLEFDPDDERYARIPRREPSDDYVIMAGFALSVEEDDVKARLEQTLRGKGAFRRFRETLAGYPDLQARWEQVKRDCLLDHALEWLAGLGIDPQYELAPLPSAAKAAQRPPEPGRPQIGLLDLLLLGGATDLVDGRVHRVFTARGPAQARKVFAKLARELAEHHGLAWRKAMVEDRSEFVVERFQLSVVGRMVELAVTLAPGVWEAFTNPGPTTGD
jgi:hypothetical protein